MRVLTLTALVRPDHTLTVDIPADVPPGSRPVVIVLGEVNLETARSSHPLVLSPHAVGLSHNALTFRREEIYGDDGQ